MFKKITIEKNGISKKISKGYSWKSLLFGCFYPAARGDFKGLITQLILCMFTGGLSWLVTPFVYNRIYLERMVNDGWMISK